MSIMMLGAVIVTPVSPVCLSPVSVDNDVICMLPLMIGGQNIRGKVSSSDCVPTSDKFLVRRVHCARSEILHIFRPSPYFSELDRVRVSVIW